MQLYTDMITVTCVRGCCSHFVFSINMLFDGALKPHCDLFSCLQIERGNIIFVFTLLILAKLLNGTLGDVCGIEKNKEDSNINSFFFFFRFVKLFRVISNLLLHLMDQRTCFSQQNQDNNTRTLAQTCQTEA